MIFDYCRRCGGERGWEAYRGRFDDGSERIDWVDCPDCHGSGYEEREPTPIEEWEIEFDGLSREAS